MNLTNPLRETSINVPEKIRRDARILVVDDDDFFRGLEEAVLKRAGYRTMGATDGREAQALLRMGDFGLVLTDWHMPNLDGVGLIRALRTAGNRIPIIMISNMVRTGSELPDDVRCEVAVALPKDAASSQILAGIGQALQIPLPTPDAAA